MNTYLQLENVHIYLNNKTLINIDEKINSGEILTVMGRSGVGKSTLLNWITGSLPDSFQATGNIWLNGKKLTDLPTHLRNIGVLYQDPLLFSHLSVRQNIAFAMPKGNKAQRYKKIHDALEQVELTGFEHRHPDSLSGGQQARVALLRLLLSEPKAVLLDEPFSKLDSELKASVREQVFRLIRTQNLPTILVTHDHSDAEAAGGKILLLDHENKS